MASTLSQANLYELTGKDTSITYTPVGFGGAPNLITAAAIRTSSSEAVRCARPLRRSVHS